VIPPANGTVVLNANGTFTYTPDADFNGTDSFTYQVSDGNGGTAQATVDVVVEAVNDAPVWTVQPNTVEVAADQVSIATFEAFDIDGDDLTYSIVSQNLNPNGVEVFEIDAASGELRFTDVPDFAFLGQAGDSPFTVLVEAADGQGLTTTTSTVEIVIRDFILPLSSNNPRDNSDGEETTEEDGTPGFDLEALPPRNIQQNSTSNIGGRNTLSSSSTASSGSADDFAYTGEGFAVAPLGSNIDLGFFESYYQAADFVQETELISQELADTYASRRNVTVDSDDAQLAALFWQNLDSSNEDYLQRNLGADNTNLVAASAGLFSAGLLFAVYGGSIAITTLATQLPAWKSLDISPLISAFDEDEESIHEIVDG